MASGRTYSFDEMLRIAWRRKWLIAGPAVLIAAATAAVATRLPNAYRTQTVILVIPQRIPESYVKSTVTVRLEDRLRSISQQILSRTHLERIINEFGLYSDGRHPVVMEDLVEHIRRDLKVDIVKGDSFRISYVGDDPVRVTRVTERLASLFIEENLHDRELLAEGTNQFLEEQLADARQRLVTQEKSIAAYRRRFAGELPSQLSANLQVMQSLELQLQSIVAAISGDRERGLILERMLADLEGTDVQGDASSASFRGAMPQPAPTAADPVEAARANLESLLERFTPGHPDVIRAKRHLDQVLDSARAAAAGGALDVRAATGTPDSARRKRAIEVRGELGQLNSHLVQQQSEENRLRQIVANYQARVEAAPGREAELTELTRDYDTLQQTYRALLTKKEDSQMAANLARQDIGEQFKILDPAKVPERPFSPNRRLIDLCGAAAGLFVGAALAFLLEYFDMTFRTAAEVASTLRLPVLATIPQVERAQKRRRGRAHVLSDATG